MFKLLYKIQFLTLFIVLAVASGCSIQPPEVTNVSAPRGYGWVEVTFWSDEFERFETVGDRRCSVQTHWIDVRDAESLSYLDTRPIPIKNGYRVIVPTGSTAASLWCTATIRKDGKVQVATKAITPQVKDGLVTPVQFDGDSLLVGWYKDGNDSTLSPINQRIRRIEQILNVTY